MSWKPPYRFIWKYRTINHLLLCTTRCIRLFAAILHSRQIFCFIYIVPCVPRMFIIRGQFNLFRHAHRDTIKLLFVIAITPASYFEPKISRREGKKGNLNKHSFMVAWDEVSSVHKSRLTVKYASTGREVRGERTHGVRRLLNVRPKS